jgi:hypothetical protein
MPAIADLFQLQGKTSQLVLTDASLLKALNNGTWSLSQGWVWKPVVEKAQSQGPLLLDSLPLSKLNHA